MGKARIADCNQNISSVLSGARGVRAPVGAASFLEGTPWSISPARPGGGRKGLSRRRLRSGDGLKSNWLQSAIRALPILTWLYFWPKTLTIIWHEQCHRIEKGLPNANILMFAMFRKNIGKEPLR